MSYQQPDYEAWVMEAKDFPNSRIQAVATWCNKNVNAVHWKDVERYYRMVIQKVGTQDLSSPLV